MSFPLFGVRINVGITWVLAAVLIAWSLAVGAFPYFYKGLAPSLYWTMAVVAVLGLGVSIVAHELAHTFTARAFGMDIRRIRLFLLGGAAELTDQPPSPRIELLMAVAGPALSVVLGFVFGAGSLMAKARAGPPALVDVLDYLSVVNFVIAAFNMVPAFPLDGGRVLRALIWMATRDLDGATRIAATIGELLGWALIAFGVVVALTGAIASGLWEALIGIFLRTAARAERLQTTMSASLSKRTVRMVVTPDPLIASADMSVEQFVHDRLYAHRHDLFPVVEGDRLIGVIGRQEIAGTPRSEWAGVPIAQICTPIADDMLVEADAPAQSAFRRLMGGGRGLVVVDRGRVIGVLTLQDLLERIRLQLELEGAFQPRRQP